MPAIAPLDVVAVYNEAHAALQPAADRTVVQEAADWLKWCANDFAQLWHREGAWAVTMVQESKAGRALCIVAWAGEDSDEMLAEIEDWARSVGCVRSYYTGRVGWSRRRPEYKVVTVTGIKEL